MCRREYQNQGPVSIEALKRGKGNAKKQCTLDLVSMTGRTTGVLAQTPKGSGMRCAYNALLAHRNTGLGTLL